VPWLLCNNLLVDSETDPGASSRNLGAARSHALAPLSGWWGQRDQSVLAARWKTYWRGELGDSITLNSP
jgi:hypothetical protein